MSEMVELIVETEAEVGATGFRVSGGGKEGIFVKEVLKNSRAAKALNLKEGDQLLSAKVYFDNARFEDVVKILQSAEPYKVAFCLKRTVPGADVAVSSKTGNLELRGPEAKKTKLSVKSISPVKKSKFMKGKVLSKEEAAVESDVPIDVEFAFPKFSKFKRLSITSPKDVEALKGESPFHHPEVEAELSLGEGQAKGKKKRLRLPAFLASESGKIKVEDDMEPKEKAAISMKPLQVAAKEEKTKMKVASFDLLSTGRKVEEDGSKAKSKPKDPGKAGVSSDGEAPESRLLLGLPVQAPKVELDIGLSKGEVDLRPPSAEGEVSAKGTGFKVKMPSFERKGAEGVDVSGMKGKIESKEVADQVVGSEGKMKVAQIAMPTIDISVPRIKQPEEGLTTSGVEIAVGSYKALGLEGKIKEIAQKITTFDISAPRVPDVDISLPKGAADDSAGAAGMGKVDVQAAEGSEAWLKMPKVSLPEFGICAQGKDEEPAAALEVAGQGFKMPSFEVSLPRMKAEDTRAEVTPRAGATGLHISKVKVDIKGPRPDGPEGKMKPPSVKVPTINIAVPKVTLPEVSKVSGQVPGTGARPLEPGAEGLDLQLKLPKVSLPKLPSGGKEVGTGGGDPEVRHGLPKFEIAIPGMKAGEPEAGMEAGAEVKDPGFRMATLSAIAMPSIDISAPKLKIPELPTGRGELLAAESGVKVGGPSELTSEGLDLKIPKVSLPSFCEGAGSNRTTGEPGSPGIEGKEPAIGLSVLKVKVPEVDIDVQLPKGRALDLIAGVDGKAGVDSPQPAPEGPDLSFQIPKVSLPTFEVKSKEESRIPGLKMPSEDVPALRARVPGVDLALPFPAKEVDSPAAATTEGSSGPGKAPKISLPKFGSKGKEELAADGTMPKVEGKGKPPDSGARGVVADNDDGPLKGREGRFKMPKVKMPTFGASRKHEDDPEVPVPGARAAEVKADPGGPRGKLKMPKVQMPSIGIAVPEMKKPGSEGLLPGAEVDVSEVELKAHGGELRIQKAKGGPEAAGAEGKARVPSVKVPAIDISVPKVKAPDVDLSFPMPRIDSTVGGAEGEATLISSEPDDGAFRLKMPKLAMPKFGSKDKDPGVEVPGGDSQGGDGDGKGVNLKARMPKVDISLPKVKPSDMDASLLEVEGRDDEPKFKLPGFSLSKIAPPKLKAPDLDLDFGLSKDKRVSSEASGAGVGGEAPGGEFQLKMPRVSLPSFGSTAADASQPAGKGKPSAEVHRGGSEGPGDMMPRGKGTNEGSKSDSETEGGRLKLKMPTFGLSSGKDPKTEAGADSGVDAAKGDKFKVKIPSVALSTPALGIGCPKDEDVSIKAKGEMRDGKEGRGGSSDSPESRFKMPQVAVAVPGVGMSCKDDEGAVAARVKGSGADAGGQGADAEGKLQLLKTRVPKVEIGLSRGEASAGGEEAETRAGQKAPDPGAASTKAPFKMPSVEISAPRTSDPPAGMELRPAEGGAGLREGDADALELKVPTVAWPTFGLCKEKSEELAGDGTSSGARMEMKGPQVGTDAGDGSEGVWSQLRDKVPKVGMELPQVTPQQEGGLATGEGRGVGCKSAKVEAVLEGAEVELKARRQLFGFSGLKSKGPEGDVEPPSPRAKERAKSAAGKGDPGGSSPEADKLRGSWVKKPSFTISWPRSKSLEVNGNGEAGDPTRHGEWEGHRSPKKGSRVEDAEDSDTLDGKSRIKLKLPKVSFAPVRPVGVKTGETAGVHINGESEDSESPGVMGQVKLPKVEFSSPYPKGRESDAELSLHLVQPEVCAANEDAGFRPQSGGSFETSTPRIDRWEAKGSKVKAPKITLKKKSGDDEAKMSHLVTSTARSELVLLESGGHTKSRGILGFKSKDPGALAGPGKGLQQKAGTVTEQSDSKDTAARFRLPKFSLGTKTSSPEQENHVHSEGRQEGDMRPFKLQMPKVGFTALYQQEPPSGEKVVEEMGSMTVPRGKRQGKAGTLADKSTSI
ncbi:periaxin-like isoform X2 [Narcine bancroftii]